MKNRQLPFWIVTASVLIGLVVPVLIKDGMFMDGLLYACISKNLSEGIGSFWFPHLSKTLYSFFDQQPPLGFGIQSLFFKMFGDSIYVERFYSFSTALITSVLIIVLWRMIFRNENEIKKLSWLPVLFWITIPVCFWSYSNNVLENTMGIFDLLALILIIRFFQNQSPMFLILSGILIFLASLTKGFQGMFPLAGIFFGWLVYRNISFSKMLTASIGIFFISVVPFFLLAQNNSAYLSLTTYLNNRVLNSIQNAADENRFYLLFRLFSELLLLLIFTGTIALIIKRSIKKTHLPFFDKHTAFFFLIGVSASFPLLVTREQRGFYLSPSLPYYAVSLAVITAPYLSFWIEKINMQRVAFRLFRMASLLSLVFVLGFSFSQIGKTGRDTDMIHDVHLIGRIVPKGTVVGSTKELWKEWALQEYLIRHYYICQDDEILPEHNYLLLDSEEQIPTDVKTEKINIPTIKYHLYKVVK